MLLSTVPRTVIHLWKLRLLQLFFELDREIMSQKSFRCVMLMVSDYTSLESHSAGQSDGNKQAFREFSHVFFFPLTVNLSSSSSSYPVPCSTSFPSSPERPVEGLVVSIAVVYCYWWMLEFINLCVTLRRCGRSWVWDLKCYRCIDGLFYFVPLLMRPFNARANRGWRSQFQTSVGERLTLIYFFFNLNMFDASTTF